MQVPVVLPCLEISYLHYKEMLVVQVEGPSRDCHEHEHTYHLHEMWTTCLSDRFVVH